MATFATLAEVKTGWTGTIALTYGGTTVTITPRTRESVASLLARLVAGALLETGLALSVVVSTNDPFLTISAASFFDLALTGTCETRTGMAGGSATSITSESSADVYCPIYGIELDGDELSASAGRAVSSGAYANRGASDAARATVTIYTTYADAWVQEAALQGVYDVWLDGRVLGRFRIDQWTRTRRGKLHNQVVLTADALAVSE